MTDALTFLRTIQPAPRDGEQLELRCKHKDAAPGDDLTRRFYGSPAALAADAARFRPEHHVWFGIALRRGGGTARHVTRAGSLWADVDAKLWGGDKGAALAAIEAFPLRPSVLVDSGGGYQAYWLFAQPFDVPTHRGRLEALNAALNRAVCGPARSPDHVQDAARIFRLPGTLNHKPEYGAARLVTVVWLDGRRCAFTALEAAVREQFPWAVRAAQVGRAPLTPIFPIRPTGRAAELGPRTRAHLHSTGPNGYQSASEADAAAAAALIATGHTEAEALALLLDSPRGQDALQRKGRHGEAYLARTIAHAATFVGPTVECDGVRLQFAARPWRPKEIA